MSLEKSRLAEMLAEANTLQEQGAGVAVLCMLSRTSCLGLLTLNRGALRLCVAPVNPSDWALSATLQCSGRGNRRSTRRCLHT